MAWDFLSDKQNQELGYAPETKSPNKVPKFDPTQPFSLEPPDSSAQPDTSSGGSEGQPKFDPTQPFSLEPPDKSLGQSLKNVFWNAPLQGVADQFRGLEAVAENTTQLTGDFQKDIPYLAKGEMSELVAKYGQKLTDPDWRANVYPKVAQQIEESRAKQLKKAADVFPPMDTNPGGTLEQGASSITRFSTGIAAAGFLPEFAGALAFFNQSLGNAYDQYRKRYPNVPKATAFDNAVLNAVLTTPTLYLGGVAEAGFAESGIAKAISAKVGEKVTGTVMSKALAFSSDLLKSAMTMGAIGLVNSFPEVLTDTRMQMPNAPANQVMAEFKKRVTSPEFLRQAKESLVHGMIGGAMFVAPFSAVGRGAEAFQAYHAQKIKEYNTLIANLTKAATEAVRAENKVPAKDPSTAGVVTKAPSETDLDAPFVSKFDPETGKLMADTVDKAPAAESGVTPAQEQGAANLAAAVHTENQTKAQAQASLEQAKQEAQQSAQAAHEAELTFDRENRAANHQEAIRRAQDDGISAAQDILDQAAQAATNSPAEHAQTVGDQLIQAIPELENNPSKHDSKVAKVFKRVVNLIYADKPENPKAYSQAITDLMTLGPNHESRQTAQEMFDIGSKALELDPVNGMDVATNMDLRAINLQSKDRQVDALKLNALNALQNLRQEALRYQEFEKGRRQEQLASGGRSAFEGVPGTRGAAEEPGPSGTLPKSPKEALKPIDPENVTQVNDRHRLAIRDIRNRTDLSDAEKAQQIDHVNQVFREIRSHRGQSEYTPVQEGDIQEVPPRPRTEPVRPEKSSPEVPPTVEAVPERKRVTNNPLAEKLRPIDPNNRAQVEERYRTALARVDQHSGWNERRKAVERRRIENIFREIRSHRGRTDYRPRTGEFAEVPPDQAKIRKPPEPVKPEPKAQPSEQQASPETSATITTPDITSIKPKKEGTIDERADDFADKLRQYLQEISPETHGHPITNQHRNIQDLASSLSGVAERYRRLKKAVDRGYKRANPEELARTRAKLERALATDLSDIKYHPIPYDKSKGGVTGIHPTIKSAGGKPRKVTNFQKRGDYNVGLVWDYYHKEPSFWMARNNTAENTSSAFGHTMEEALANAKEAYKRDQKHAYDLEKRAWTKQELLKLSNAQLRSIGIARGIEKAQTMRIAKLRQAIFETGDNALGNEGPKFSVRLPGDKSDEKAPQVSLAEAQSLLHQMKHDRLMAQLQGKLSDVELDDMAETIRNLSDQLSKFSLNGEALGGSPREHVETWLAKTQKRARGAAGLKVVQSQSELPKRILKKAKRGALIEGVYDPETHTVYLVADNIPDRRTAVQKWLHEQVGHVGMRGAFGHDPTYRKFLRDAYAVVAKAKETKADLKRIVDEYGFDVKSKNKRVNFKARESAAEEFLSRRAENERLAPKIWRKIKAMFHRFLQRWMPTHPLDPHGYKLTMDDIDGILDAAKGYTMKGWTLSNMIEDRLARRWGDVPMRADLIERARQSRGNAYAANLPKFRHTEDEFLQLVKDTYKLYPESRFFYDEGRKLLQQVFGPDADIVNILLAMTSPGTKLPGNMQFAFQTYAHLLGLPGGKPNALFPKKLAERIKGWTSLDAVIKDALDDASDYKVTEYRWGLMGDPMAVVNDRWLKRVLFGSDFSDAGTDAQLSVPQHLAARQMILELTNRMTQDTGEQWTPAEVQAVLWAHGRNTRTHEEKDAYDYVKAGAVKMKPLGKKGAWDWIQEQAKAAGIDLREGHLMKKWGYSDPDAISKLVTKRRMEKDREKVFGPWEYLTPEPKSLGMGVHFKNTVVAEGGKLKASQLAVDTSGNAIVKNSYSRSDLGRRMEANTPDNPYQPLVYFYHAGTVPESQLRGKPVRVNVEFDKSRIYDAIKDAFGFHKRVVQEMIKDPKIWYTGTGDPRLDGAYTNVLARLIKETGKFDGFLASDPRNPTKGRWVLLFDEAAVSHGFLDNVNVGISDVVESESADSQDISKLDKHVFERTRAFERRMRRLNKDYHEITLNRVIPSIAQFGEATSGMLERGAGLTISGPRQSVRAFLAELGIEHKQGQIYLMEPVKSKAQRNGVVFEFATDFRSARDLQKALADRGISEFNMVRDEMGRYNIRQFVFEDENDIKDFAKVAKALARPGDPRNLNYDVNSQIIGDPNYNGDPTGAMEEYRKELIKFHGEENGQKRYEKALERQAAFLGKSEGKDQGPEGNGTNDRPPRIHPSPGGPDTGVLSPEQPASQKPQKDGWVINPNQINPQNTGPSFSYKSVPSREEATPEAEKWVDEIGGKPISTKERIKRVAKKLLDIRANTVDRLADLDRLEKKANLQDLTLSGYRSKRLLTSLPTIMEEILEQGDIKFKQNWSVVEKRKDGGLLNVFEDLGPDTPDFLHWMMGQSALELSERGDRGPIFGISHEDDRAKIAALIGRSAGHDKAKWTKAARRLHEINNAILDFTEAAGVINAEDRKTWERDNYLPFNRMVDNYQTGDLETMFPKGGKGSATAQAIHRLKGSNLTLGDGLENLVNTYMFLVRESLKNLANKKSLKIMIENGLAEEVSPKTKMRDGIVGVRVKGRELKYQIKDPSLFEAIQDAPPAVVPAFLRWWKKALTYGVTLAPAFRIANLLRDTLATGIIKGQLIREMGRAVRDFREAWRNSPEVGNTGVPEVHFLGVFIEPTTPRVLAGTYVERSMPRPPREGVLYRRCEISTASGNTLVKPRRRQIDWQPISVNVLLASLPWKLGSKQRT